MTYIDVDPSSRLRSLTSPLVTQFLKKLCRARQGFRASCNTEKRKEISAALGIITKASAPKSSLEPPFR